MTLTITDLFIPPELLQSVVDVQRGGAVGRDDSGAPVETWTTIYTGLSCAIDMRPAGEQDTFGQPVAEFNVPVYFGRLPDLYGGGLPDIRNRDRLVYGTWPSGQTRYLNVNEALDELGVGVVLVASCKARRPA